MFKNPVSKYNEFNKEKSSQRRTVLLYQFFVSFNLSIEKLSLQEVKRQITRGRKTEIEIISSISGV